MFNWKLIKHIMIYELRWSLTNIGRSYKIIFLLLLFLKFLTFRENFEPEVLVILLIFIGVFSSGNQILGAAGFYRAVPGGISLKYLNMVLEDRKSFVLGVSLSSLIKITLLIFPFGLIGAIFDWINLEDLWAILIMYICGMIFSVHSIRLVIEAPRKLNYYDFKWGKLKFIRDFFTGSILIVNFLAIILLLGILPLYLTRFIPWQSALCLYAVFIWGFAFYSLLCVWDDENLTHWNGPRELKKILKRFSVLGVIFGSLYLFNVSVDSFMDDEQFDSMRRVSVEKLKVAIEEKKVSISELDEYDKSGFTHLHKAILYEQTDLARYLIEIGVDLSLKVKAVEGIENSKSKDHTALMLAISKRNFAISELLVDKQDPLLVNAQGASGESALSLASENCRPHLVKKLVEIQGADVNLALKDGRTPIFFTAQERGRGCLSVFLYLKKMGANLEAKNKDGLTAREYIKFNSPRFYEEIEFMEREFLSSPQL